MSLCWYVLLSLCLIYQTAEPEQAKWTAERSIYGLVIGISLLSCSILIADASLRGYVWESSEWQDYNISVRCKIQINLKKMPPRDFCVDDTNAKQQSGQMDRWREKSLQIDWLKKENMGLCKQCFSRLSDFWIECKSRSDTSFLYLSLAVCKWQNIVVSRGDCIQTSTETMHCMHTWLYLRVCVSVCATRMWIYRCH